MTHESGGALPGASAPTPPAAVGSAGRADPADARQANAERVALIERSILVLLVAGLFVGVIAVVKPFTTAILFGASLAAAAWPVREALLRRGLGRAVTATILLLSSIALVGLPILAVAPNLSDQLNDGMESLRSYYSAAPAQPAWLGGIPLIGRHLVTGWERLIETRGDLRALATPYAADIGQLLVVAARALADSVLQVILSLVVATMFWTNGDAVVSVLRDALRRIGGPTAAEALDVAGSAVRGVAYGVVGTAIIQAILLGLGLAVAGIPGAAMLGFIGLLFAISQIGGPLLILIWGGAAWWLFAHDAPIWGWFMIVWGLFVGMVDNFIKPWLIGFGMQMPMSLIILGVFGGFIAFGFLGMFIGPTLIAVLFTLLQTWREASQTTTPAGD